jgi:ribonuclease inhibitor
MINKIKLNLAKIEEREELHTYLQKKMRLPESYGRNLDALFACLMEIREDTCFGIYEPARRTGATAYMERMNKVFLDAEQENEHVCVFIYPDIKNK